MLASAPDQCEELTSGTYSPPPAFGRFRLLHQIGAGVLGPVFRTHDPDHERLAAVKAFTFDLTPEQAGALSIEFKRLVDLDLDDPCIAAPLATGVEEFVPFLAVSYVAGESLDAAIRQYGPAPAGDAIRLIAHVAEALDAAAHVGVFHGSLHPRDIIVTPGETHVTGFGIAQALERVGLHGPVRRPYVAPEREGGDEWGAAADVYSLAAIAYEVLTGRRALPGTEQPVPALSELRVHDPSALKDAIESALDPDPERRPARALDFSAALAAALSDAAGPLAAGERAAEKRPRKPRTRPPKLPGIDEPLLPADGAAKGRSKAAVTPVPAAEFAPAQDAPESPAPPADVRYVPVADPADGGDEPRAAGEALGLPDLRLDTDAGPAPDTGLPVFPAMAPAIEAGPTPDLRQADHLLPGPDVARETMDVELTAALDRLAAENGAGPTPSSIGIDIVGPGPAEHAVPEEMVGPDLSFDLAAETRVAFHLPDDFVSAPAAEPPAQPEGRESAALEPATSFPGPERPTSPAPRRDKADLDLGALDFSFPPGVSPAAASDAAAIPDEPPPFLRSRSAERRRTPPRAPRSEVAAPEPVAAEPPAQDVPRAFERARSTPPERPAPAFEMLSRPPSGQPPVGPVVIGVVAGLIIGLAAGYWLGSRGAPPATQPPAAASAPAAAPATAATPSPAVVPPPVPAPVPTTTPDVGAEKPPAAPAAAAPAATAAQGPAAAAPQARGSIAVDAAPLQANVFLDGERNGLTPRNLKDVPLGSHTIKVTRPGYEPQEQTVELTAQAPSARVTFTLVRAGAAPAPAAAAPAPAAPAPAAQAPAALSVLTLLVESTPAGAHIRIDGRDLGVTPLLVRQLRPGTHRLELRLAGYRPWSSSVSVAAGDHRTLTAPLERDTSR
jgi:hypothetical protein